MRYNPSVDAPEITVLQLPKFKTDATELIAADGIGKRAVYLINPRMLATRYRAQAGCGS